MMQWSAARRPAGVDVDSLARALEGAASPPHPPAPATVDCEAPAADGAVREDVTGGRYGHRRTAQATAADGVVNGVGDLLETNLNTWWADHRKASGPKWAGPTVKTRPTRSGPIMIARPKRAERRGRIVAALIPVAIAGITAAGVFGADSVLRTPGADSQESTGA